MIKAIFFDMSGVLYEEPLQKAIQAYAKEFGISKDKVDDIVHNHAGWKDFTLGYISEKEYFDLCSQIAGQHIFMANKYKELLKKFTKANKKLIAYIKKDLAKKYIIGVISNNPKEWYEGFLDDFALREIVNINAISSYLHIRKPDKRIFQMAVEKSKVQANETIYIDDRLDRTSGAKDIGMNVIIFDNISNLKKRIKPYERS